MSRSISHRSLLLVVFILVMSAMTVVPMATPPPAQAISINPCNLIPDAGARTVCKDAIESAAGPAGPVISAAVPGIPSPNDVVGNVVNAGAQAIVAPILNQIAQAEASAVSYVLKKEVSYIDSSTTPALSSEWFSKQYALVFGIGFFLAIVMFYLRIGNAARNQDAVDIGKSVAAFAAFCLIGAVLPLAVGTVLKVTDGQIAPAFMDLAGQSTTATLNGMEVNFQKELSLTNNGLAPILLPLIFLFFGLIGGVILEVMLLFRVGMLYVLTAAAALAFALNVGGSWGRDAASSIIRPLITLILLKIVMAFILVVGLQLLDTHDGTQASLVGSVMLLMVPVLTWAFYRKGSDHNIRFIPGGTAKLTNAYRGLRS